MELMMDKQIEILMSIQSLTYPYFVKINQSIAYLQSYIALSILIAIFWVVNKKIGARILLLYFIATILVWIIKDWTEVARPVVLGSPLGYVQVTGFSFPSGDACLATVTYGAIACYFRKFSLYVLAFIIILLVSYSRLALGVHYPTDVLGGIGLGLILLVFQFRVIEYNLDMLNAKTVLFPLVLSVLPLTALFYLTEKIPLAAIGALSGFSLALYIFRNQKPVRLASVFTKISIISIGIILVTLLIFTLKYFNFDIIYKTFIIGCWLAIYRALIDSIFSKSGLPNGIRR